MDLKSCPVCSQLTALDNDTCPYCGHAFDTPSVGPVTGPRTSRQQKQRAELRNPLLAAACAFLFLGWGQWYNGRTAEGIYVIAASAGLVIVSGMLMFIFRNLSLIITAIAGLTGILLLVIWVYSVTAAYNTARGINRGGIPFTGKSILFWMPATLWTLLAIIIVLSVASMVIHGLLGAGILSAFTRVGGFITLHVSGF